MFLETKAKKYQVTNQKGGNTSQVSIPYDQVARERRKE